LLGQVQKVTREKGGKIIAGKGKNSEIRLTLSFNRAGYRTLRK